MYFHISLIPRGAYFLLPLVGIVIYLPIEGTLYAQKSVPSWLLAVFDSKIDVC